jgi:hypothetical protein
MLKRTADQRAYTLPVNNADEANAVAGIYATLPSPTSFYIGAMIVTLSPTRLHIAIDTNQDNIADAWASIPATAFAEAQPVEGEQNGS